FCRGRHLPGSVHQRGASRLRGRRHHVLGRRLPPLADSPTPNPDALGRCAQSSPHSRVDSPRVKLAARGSNRTTEPTIEKGTAIMKLTTITNVSVDGVMQGLAAP